MTDPVRNQPDVRVDPQRAATTDSGVTRADIDRAVNSRNPLDGQEFLHAHPELAPQIADSALRNGNFSLAHSAQNTPPVGSQLPAANDGLFATPGQSVSPFVAGAGIGLHAASTHLTPVSAVAPGAASSPLSTIPMVRQFNGEHLPNNHVWGTQVSYLTPEESAARKLSIGTDGKLYDVTGKLFDTTKSNAIHGGGGQSLFVMDQHGNMYASMGADRPGVGKFHHSSLLAGHDVSMAGEIRVENGQLKSMTNASGHYAPSEQMLARAESHLKGQGLDFSQASVTPSGFAQDTRPRVEPRPAPMTADGRPAATAPSIDPAATRPTLVDPANVAKTPPMPEAVTAPKVAAVDPAVARAAQIADIAGKVGRPLLVVGAAIDTYNLVTSDNKVETGSRIAGGWAGAWGGAQAGAAIGTFVGGPIGTVVGGVVGGVAGYMVGSEVGQAAYDALKEPVGTAVEGVKDAWNSIFG